MSKTVKVDFLEWHRLKYAIEDMQGKTFYCEDPDGFLRRWHPARPLHRTTAEVERVQ